MTISVVCECGKSMQVKDEMAGRRGKCPACGQIVEIGQPNTNTNTNANVAADDPFGLGNAVGAADPFGSAGFGSAFGGGPGAGGGGYPGLGASPFSSPAEVGGANLGGMNLPGRAPVAAAAASSSSDKPLFLQWHVLAIGLCVVVLLVVAGLFVFGGGSTPEPTPAAVASTPSANTPEEVKQPEAPPPFRIVRAELADLEPGGDMAAQVEIDRGETQSPIKFHVEDLPTQVSVAAAELPPEQNELKLVFKAADDAEEGEFSARLVATLGESSIEHAVTLKVQRIPPPNVLPLASVSLQPGEQGTVEVRVERNGHEGPLQIQVEGLPDKVTASPLSIPADQSSGQLELLAAADAAEAKASPRVLATIDGRTGEGTFSLSLEKFPFRLLPLMDPVVWMEPDKPRTVEVKVQRRSYQGPIEVRVEGLPEGVTASPLTIAEGQTSGHVTLSVEEDAADRVRSARLTSPTPGCPGPQALIVRVKKNEGSLLPEVNIDPELAGLLKRGSFGGRLTSESKQALMDIYGGTPESEAAVLAGLRWLAAHQAEDGHWSLESYKGSSDCNCKIEHEAEVTANNTAATAFGVLPFLGAGITPLKAPDSPEELKDFQETVKKGLHYLVSNQKTATDHTNGYLGGGMYAHALGTIALCEAYGLTKHDSVKVPAQKAVRYLMQAQHTPTGGWGYSPRKEGDTSVVAWVFLAIRSGQLAGIPFDQEVLRRADRFLNSTAAGPEPLARSRYSYKPEGKATLALTAAGLLSRQYLGWQHGRAELLEGSSYLMTSLPPENGAALGPSYYYYYATQVLHHMEGKNWDLWNHRIREHLIRSQEQSEHKQGSWSPQGCDFGHRGGRLYSTSMSILTLQVYYRHLPLYRKISPPLETASN